MEGFARVAVSVPLVSVADVERNTAGVREALTRAHEQHVDVVVTPELALSSYTARDLFFDGALLHGVLRGLRSLLEHSRDLSPLLLVGAPVRDGGALYNAAVAIQGGRVLGVVPKSYLPNYREFEERRWFRPGTEVRDGATLRLLDDEVPFGTDLLFAADGARARDLVVGVELCEDLWVPHPPSLDQCAAGATVCVNLSASNFTVGKAELRRLLARSVSDRGKCAYLYTAAGPGESSTDVAFDADAFVVENGRVTKESVRFSRAAQLVVADVDLEALVHERLVTNTFGDSAAERARRSPRAYRRVTFSSTSTASTSFARALVRAIDPHPFLPHDPATLDARCHEIFEIQVHALATRMERLPSSTKLVLGLSGGLDSTHAALVCTGALDLLARPRADLVAVTMPGLGTTSGTRANAIDLSRALACTLHERPVSELSKDVLATVEHKATRALPADASVDDLVRALRADPKLADVTVENVQARLRTLVLMTIANQVGGIVVGTGDLSEKALGWSTYAGDHISMYDVNAGVPKTLIRFLIDHVRARRAEVFSRDLGLFSSSLRAILDTPISPELLPPDEKGDIAQHTEAHVGPYELHDFFLFHVVRFGRPPRRVLALARHAFGERYSERALTSWLRVFYTRFFTQQFKRSCTPDGPKVGMVSLSPRSDWRMPSDAQVTLWLAELDDG